MKAKVIDCSRHCVDKLHLLCGALYFIWRQKTDKDMIQSLREACLDRALYAPYEEVDKRAIKGIFLEK